MFQLTTSRRGRLRSYYLLANLQCFNSRPHEEVDCWTRCCCPQSDVSTHDLTKRSTWAIPAFSAYNLRFNSRPHEEVDLGDYISNNIEKLFQLTTSRRGRQQFLRKKFSFQNHFLCSLHIIYSYYINTIFFSTLFLAKSSFFLVRIL